MVVAKLEGTCVRKQAWSRQKLGHMRKNETMRVEGWPCRLGLVGPVAKEAGCWANIGLLV